MTEREARLEVVIRTLRNALGEACDLLDEQGWPARSETREAELRLLAKAGAE
jgi:hypothetical protein